MSGTTALTGRTAERIDQRGIADTVRFIKPFFQTADLVHVTGDRDFVREAWLIGHTPEQPTPPQQPEQTQQPVTPSTTERPATTPAPGEQSVLGEAQSGTSSSEANFDHPESATPTPRAAGELTSQNPQIRNNGTSASFVFELETYCVKG